jgi:hypothetical protein
MVAVLQITVRTRIFNLKDERRTADLVTFLKLLVKK